VRAPGGVQEARDARSSPARWTTSVTSARASPPRQSLGVLKLPASNGSGPSLHATNVMPALVEGALCNCTLGEMVQAMADVYGRYTGGPEWFSPRIFP
jgi:methylmalonyl-CoA mutase N-terminal domain/subunit